jgi:SNF2 family DNA or RNA helicase
MLDILHGFLQTRGYGCHRLDGNTDRNTREQIISDFANKKSTNRMSMSCSSKDALSYSYSSGDVASCPVFLLSTRAGEKPHL